jgi:hypothetical protein
MKRSRKTSPRASLSALYDRLDAVRMTAADRAYARSALAQADAVAGGLLAVAGFAKRIFGARALHPTSAHS